MEICREKMGIFDFFPNDHLIIINSIKTEGLLLTRSDATYHIQPNMID